MEMMGGTVALSSVPGQGSCFTARVALPVAAALQAANANDVAAPRGFDALALKGLRVLVVDDHPANRMLLQSQLVALGCEVETAADGKAAFAHWTADGAFDVVLTDCSMPLMSGEDLTRAIRAREAADGSAKPVRIVGVTANAQPEAVADALDAGMTLCLVKPLGLDALCDALSPARPDARQGPAALADPADPADGFAAHAPALVDVLKTANRQDLDDAARALAARDLSRLRDIAHRVKGAALMVGATSLADACTALQQACAASEEASVDLAYERLRRETLDLDTALARRTG
jgi:two-component system sensor histidine kinase EvgS